MCNSFTNIVWNISAREHQELNKTKIQGKQDEQKRRNLKSKVNTK